MNIFEEYITKKKELEPLKQKIVDRLARQEIYSVETFLILASIVNTPGITQRQVAKATDISVNTVSTVILKLAEKGLITNEKDSSDTSDRTLKRKLLNPTDKGKEIYTQLMQQFETE